jgi:phage host-nuclease inhibitor protein Gam
MLQFDQIEQKIGLLIKRCRNLEAENSQLIEKVRRLETTIQSNIETENRFAEQKEMIRSKIDNLMERLENLSETNSEE